MSEPLELQAQRPYALDQLTMLQSQIMQTIQGMVVLRARIEKQRRSNIEAARDTYTELDRARGRLIEQLSKSELFLLEMTAYQVVATPAEGYQFLGWYNLTTGKCIATAASTALNMLNLPRRSPMNSLFSNGGRRSSYTTSRFLKSARQRLCAWFTWKGYLRKKRQNNTA